MIEEDVFKIRMIERWRSHEKWVQWDVVGNAEWADRGSDKKSGDTDGWDTF